MLSRWAEFSCAKRLKHFIHNAHSSLNNDGLHTSSWRKSLKGSYWRWSIKFTRFVVYLLDLIHKIALLFELVFLFCRALLKVAIYYILFLSLGKKITW